MKQQVCPKLYFNSHYIKPYKLILAFTIIGLIVIALLEIASPFILKIAIDNYPVPKNYAGFLNMVLLFALVIIMQFAIRYFQQYSTEYMGEKIMFDLSKKFGIIQETLKKILEKRTSIIIAHRLSTIKNVDKIIVLSKGRIIESGNHNELIKNKNLYYKLYKYQYQLQ